MAATKTKSRAKKAPTPTKSGKAKPTAKAKPKAAAKKAAAPAPKKPTATKAKKPAAAKAKAKAKKPAPPPVVDVDVDDVMDAPAAEAGADESSNGDVSETAKTGAFARIKKGVGSFFSKIARKKPQQPADDADAGDEPPPTIEVATGDILVEAEDRAKLRAGKKPPPPPQPNDDDE